MNITVKKLAELHKPAHNIRRHSDKQITEYIRSIEMFGQVKPLVVAEDGEIIAGNGLYEALLRMGRETCDCYVMVGLTDVQKKKLMMADNKVYELGFTDVDAIEELVKELDGDVDVPGWDADLLDMVLLNRSTTRPCTRGCCTEIPRCVSCASSGPPSTTTTTPASRRSRTMENIDVFAPLASLQWVDRNTIHANDYNPNKVSEENLKLLVQSILTNGWTLPIVVRPDGTIIDGFHRWTVSGREPLLSLLGGKVPVVVVDHHGDESADVYGTITHNRARGTHLLDPMKAIVKKLMDEGKTVDEIGKQLGMKPEEIFRLSGFTKDEFLNMMTKDHPTYSKAKVIRSI